MKVFLQGCFVRVTASAEDCELFAHRWPCSGFEWGDRFSFLFNADNGDLVDYGNEATGQEVNESAMAALADDCKAYAKKRHPFLFTPVPQS